MQKRFAFCVYLHHKLTIRNMPAATVALTPHTVLSDSLLHITQSPSVNKWITTVNHKLLFILESFVCLFVCFPMPPNVLSDFVVSPTPAVAEV